MSPPYQGGVDERSEAGVVENSKNFSLLFSNRQSLTQPHYLQNSLLGNPADKIKKGKINRSANQNQ